jgi:beta-N-acetylhexosaminidase
MLDQILSLPIERKIGQLFFIGLRAPHIDDEARALLSEISPGGVCLFARNIREAEQTRALLDDVRSSLPVEPLLSLDQEGGLVDRLRRVVEPMPAPNLLRRPEEAEKLALLTAEIVRLLGFNMNFAPVVDVITESRGRYPNGIYSRTFGRTPEDVAAYAGRYLKTMQDAGCLGSIKHFPGLGSSRVDSHEELPRVEIADDEFESVDLAPYRELLETGDVRCVMAAHAAYPNSELQETDRDGKLLPSSLSYNFITGLLREKLGFEGLVLTDDLEMGAILKNYGIGEACRMAIRAGVDQVLICNDAEAVRAGYRAVLEAVKSGELDEHAIDKSLQRIAAVKNLIEPPPAFDRARLETLSNEISDLKATLNKYTEE